MGVVHTIINPPEKASTCLWKFAMIYTLCELKGREFEDTACEYLLSLGYRIVKRNFHCRVGEIDIIAIDGETLVFVEVKGSSSNNFGDPAERISKRKMDRIIKCIESYISSNTTESIRIDLVIVRGKDIEHIKGVEL